MVWPKGRRRTEPIYNRGKGKCVAWLHEHANYDGPDCLIWPFSTARGYGNLGFNGELCYAHNIMCEIVHGPAPTPAHQAAHSCGRGHLACVHPKHISWKTPSENQLDKRTHGTSYRGGRRRKLTSFDADAIRLLKGKMTHDEMAAIFKVSRRNIGAILDGRSWVQNKKSA